MAEHSEMGILPSQQGALAEERGEMAWVGQGDGSPLGGGAAARGRWMGGDNGVLRFRLLAGVALVLLVVLIIVAVVGWVV